MDSPWTWTLIGLALVTMALSRNVPRAWWWIAAGGVDFLITTLFLDYGDHPEMHPILTFGCDALVCFLAIHYSREDWELGIAVAFLASVFSSILKLVGAINQDWVYAALLEACNAGALLCIAGTGIIDMAGRHEGSRLHTLRARLHCPRHSL